MSTTPSLTSTPTHHQNMQTNSTQKTSAKNEDTRRNSEQHAKLRRVRGAIHPTLLSLRSRGWISHYVFHTLQRRYSRKEHRKWLDRVNALGVDLSMDVGPFHILTEDDILRIEPWHQSDLSLARKMVKDEAAEETYRQGLIEKLSQTEECGAIMEIEEELLAIDARKEENKRREEEMDREDEAERILECGLTREEKKDVYRRILAEIKADPTEPEKIGGFPEYEAELAWMLEAFEGNEETKGVNDVDESDDSDVDEYIISTGGMSSGMEGIEGTRQTREHNVPSNILAEPDKNRKRTFKAVFGDLGSMSGENEEQETMLTGGHAFTLQLRKQRKLDTPSSEQ